MRCLCKKWEAGTSERCARPGVVYERTYLNDTCDLALAHVEDAEFATHGERDDLVPVHPDISDLLVWDTLVKRPRSHVLL